MHHFIFPTKTAWISSGSNKVTGVTEQDQNFGQDEILELKKFYYNNSFDYQTRVLIDFTGPDFTKMSQSIHNNDITSPKFYLRLYEAQGNQELSSEYKLATYPLSESWVEGVGKFEDIPKVTNGVSWINRSNPVGGAATAWVNTVSGEEVSYISASAYVTSQSFSNESPDVEMDITRTVDSWLNGTNANYGLLLRFSGSQETDSTTFGNLKFFSRHTNTIYAPKLEVRWDDHTAATGDNTGSLNELTMSGAANNYLYPKNLKDSYKEGERVKFRVGARLNYVQKTFSSSLQTQTGSYITEGSGSYAIKDIATDEYIVPFSAHTTMSCDSTSPYFNQWLDGFYPDRIYKVLFKIKYDDNQEEIFDNGFEFKVKR